jgi:drug/metabolite transporter (DMT)-like permease
VFSLSSLNLFGGVLFKSITLLPVKIFSKEIPILRGPRFLDYFLLSILGLIWASAFFNIKIARYSYDPATIAFLRVFLGSIPVLALCFFKKIKIEAFSRDWLWFAVIGLINLVIPFFLIAYSIKNIQSNLAALLMASAPLNATLLAHFFTQNEKINRSKIFGVLLGFSGIIFLFFDKTLLNESNFISGLLILLASAFYVLGGLLTLKMSKKENGNVTASTLIWASLFLLPCALFWESPLNLKPRLDSTLSLIYLGIFPTGIAWLLRFHILKNNGLVFQSQVAYLIPILGVFLGAIMLNETITPKVIISLIAVILGIFIVKRGNKI